MYSKTILVGRLGHDPEISYLKSGKAVCEFSMATTSSYKSGDDWEESTTWHNIEVWGSKAEAQEKHLSKGDLVLVVGTPGVDKWEDTKNDVTRVKPKVSAYKVIWIDVGNDGDTGNQNSGPNPDYEQSFSDDDIPF